MSEIKTLLSLVGVRYDVLARIKLMNTLGEDWVVGNWKLSGTKTRRKRKRKKILYIMHSILDSVYCGVCFFFYAY